MRAGNNPKRSSVADDAIKPIVLSVVTHLPETGHPYHAGRLEVIQTCLETMRMGARADATFLIWDNGSSKAFRNWIQSVFHPDVLILSGNIGKGAARTSIARMLPQDTVLACSDDDILYTDNWFEPQMEILSHFPNVSCVTGYPVRTAFRWGVENTKAWAQENGIVTMGQFIPREWEDDFAVSVGRTPAWHADYTKDELDVMVEYEGKQAYCTSHHCQFIGRAGRIVEASHFDGQAMGDEKPFDIAMDKLGLRLATTHRLARHIGNVMDDKIKEEASWLGT